MMSDTAVLFMIRALLFLAVMAVIPFILAGCNKVGTQGGGFNATASAEYRDILPDGSTAQTRSPLPQRGVDEKSDSSLTKPTN